MIMPDYALSHALNVLLITYVKQRERQYHLNIGNFVVFHLNGIFVIFFYGLQIKNIYQRN